MTRFTLLATAIILLLVTSITVDVLRLITYKQTDNKPVTEQQAKTYMATYCERVTSEQYKSDNLYDCEY